MPRRTDTAEPEDELPYLTAAFGGGGPFGIAYAYGVSTS